MTTITVTIEGPSFKLKADFAPPDKSLFNPADPESVKRLNDLQIEGFLVQEFMPKIKAMSDNLMLDLQRQAKRARRRNERAIIRADRAPAATSESSDRPPAA